MKKTEQQQSKKDSVEITREHNVPLFHDESKRGKRQIFVVQWNMEILVKALVYQYIAPPGELAEKLLHLLVHYHQTFGLTKQRYG